MAQVRQVVRDDDGLRARTATGEARLLPDGGVRPLARGAIARFGDLEVWIADGYAYARRAGETRAIDAVGPRERAWVGGGGAVVVEGPAGVRAGAPGRTPRAVGPGEGIRVAEDGLSIAVHGPDGAFRVTLADGSRRSLRGLPITDALAWDEERADGPVAREGTAAFRPALLAGPDGRVWDLRASRPVTAAGTVCAGVTVAVAGGFLTIDGDTGRGGFVDASGPGWRVELPLDPDDVVRDALVDEHGVRVGTALGAGFRVGQGGALATAAPPPRVRRRHTVTSSPAGLLPTTGTAELDGSTFAWNDAGWLWRFAPTPPQAN